MRIAQWRASRKDVVVSSSIVPRARETFALPLACSDSGSWVSRNGSLRAPVCRSEHWHWNQDLTHETCRLQLKCHGPSLSMFMICLADGFLRLAPLLRVHVPTRTHLDPATSLRTLASQDTWQVVLIHEVPLLRPLLRCDLTLVLLLILC